MIIIICQMGRFNGFLSAKQGDYYYHMPNGATQWIFKCQMGRLLLYAKWDDSLLYAKWCDIRIMVFLHFMHLHQHLVLSLVFVLILYFRMMNILNLKGNVLAQFLNDGCIFLFDVLIYY